MSRQRRRHPEQPDAYLAIPAMEELRRFQQAPNPASLMQARQRILDDGASATAKIGGDIDSLRATIAKSDALRLHGALHMWDVRARHVLSGPQLHGSDALLEFFAGLLTSLPEPKAIANLRRPFDPQTVLDAERQLRIIGQSQAAIDFAEAYGEPPKSSIESAVRLLTLERHFDRMAGFDRHLRRIAEPLFEAVDDSAHLKLGFKLSDALRFADLYNLRLLQHWENTSERISQEHPPLPSDADEHEKLQWIMSDMLAFVLDAAAPLEQEVESLIATELDVTTESFESLLAALSTPLGSQEVNDLHGDNRVRTHPILRLSSGEWQWCRPADFIHSMFDWAFEECSQNAKLLRAFDKSRQTVAERIPVEIMQSVFGDDAVFSNVTYPAEQSDAEADALVCLPGANVIVECKGGRISTPARRGAPKRVEKHADDIAVKGADQNLRTVKAIEAGLSLRDSRRHAIPVEATDLNFGLVVTFDRIDPFNTFLGDPSTGGISDRSLIVALPDLLLIADLLPSRAEFFSYIRKRVEMVRADSHRVIVEGDALGGWCKDRLSTCKPLFPGTFAVIDETSTEVNDYYAFDTAATIYDDAEALIGKPERPNAGVPQVVLESLERLIAAQDRRWLQLCKQAFDVRPRDWRQFNVRLELARGTTAANSRISRKKLAQARRGFVVAGVLPVRFDTDVQGASEHVLLVKP
jgi:hypothetical protein